eukprot:5911500-Prymnesium_polylepis.1
MTCSPSVLLTPAATELQCVGRALPCTQDAFTSPSCGPRLSSRSVRMAPSHRRCKLMNGPCRRPHESRWSSGPNTHARPTCCRHSVHDQELWSGACDLRAPPLFASLAGNAHPGRSDSGSGRGWCSPRHK